MLRQRIYGIALGNEDLNDHITLRHDPAWQAAVEEDKELLSSSTLCSFENQRGRKAAWMIHPVILEQFISVHKRRPKELILDFDATDVSLV